MKSVFFVLIFFLGINTLFAQKGDGDEVLDQICSLIVKDQPEKIWELGSEEFKKDSIKEDFYNKIHKIHQQLKVNEIEDLCDLKSDNTTSTQYLNGESTTTYSKTFRIEPYFSSQHKFLSNSYGHIVEIKLSYNGSSGWRLNNITYEENFISQENDPEDFVTGFFSNADTIYLGFEIISGEEFLIGRNICLKTDINADLVNSLCDVTYFGTTNNLPDDTLKLYSILFRKLVPRESSDDIFDVVKSKFKIMTLEYTFYDSVDHKIMISYDNKFAYYSAHDLKHIISFIHKKIDLQK